MQQDPRGGKPNDSEATRVTVTQARRQFADIVSRAEYAGVRTEITRRGRVIAVIAPPQQCAA